MGIPPTKVGGRHHPRVSSTFDREDLPTAVVDEVVIPLHDGFELLPRFGIDVVHGQERSEVLHLVLVHDRPESLAAHVGEDPHPAHAVALHELRHREELLLQRLHLAGLAVVYIANEEHACLTVSDGGLASRNGAVSGLPLHGYGRCSEGHESASADRPFRVRSYDWTSIGNSSVECRVTRQIVSPLQTSRWIT